jgi:TM2 domain-containing membrane protein YozV
MTDDELRIGTAEREAAVKLLGDHMAEGRLALEEYEERTAAALEARTRADLRPLFRDLPLPHPAFMAPSPPLPAPYPNLPPPAPFQHGRPPAPGQSDRYRVAAGVLQIVLPFGIGRFYTGHTGMAVAQLLTSFIGVGVLWSWIDGIIILASGGRDAYGRELRM